VDPDTLRIFQATIASLLKKDPSGKSVDSFVAKLKSSGEFTTADVASILQAPASDAGPTPTAGAPAGSKAYGSPSREGRVDPDADATKASARGRGTGLQGADRAHFLTTCGISTEENLVGPVKMPDGALRFYSGDAGQVTAMLQARRGGRS
jgi:hypothetical protein